VTIVRWLGALLIAAALVGAAAHVSATSAPSPSAAPCTSSALSEAVHGAFTVLSVQNFGCEGRFAYLWATVGTNEADAIGVTEVLEYSTLRDRWSLVSRERWCHPGLMAEVVYRQGCFSN
jgi:hypothetical protein